MDADEYARMAAAAERHWWYQATRKLLADTLGRYLPDDGRPLRFLDAAGGSGATGRWLADRAPTAVVDVDVNSLRQTPTASAGYMAAVGNLNRLPHADGTFDAVLCVTALYHQLNTDPAATVAELVRVTRPGGVVCLMEPGVRRLWRGHDVVTHAARRFSRHDLADLLQQADCEVLRRTGAYTFLVPPAAVLAVLERGEANSDVGREQSRVGGFLGALATAERAVLRRVNLPTGLSVLAVGRRPGGEFQ